MITGRLPARWAARLSSPEVTMIRLALAALCGVLVLAATPVAQVVARSEADLVVLHVSVFDGRSDAVPDLPRSAFVVRDNDEIQDITFFSSTDVPVAVGLVIDNSGSMIARRPMVLAGASAFAASSRPEDDLFSVIFNEHVRFGLPGGVRFTRSREQLTSSLSSYPTSGRTALHDAVIAGLDHLKNASHQKRALVVLSDGDDNASRQTRAQMLAAATASDALIYTVARRDSTTGTHGNPSVMKKLAEATGGVAYFPRTDKDVVDSFGEIAGNIHRGYSIGYVPASSGDGRYHRVTVTAHMPGRTRLSTHTRDGYVAPRPDGAP